MVADLERTRRYYAEAAHRRVERQTILEYGPYLGEDGDIVWVPSIDEALA